MKTYTLHVHDAMGKDFVLVDDEGKKIEGVYEFNMTGAVGELVRLEVYLAPVGTNATVIMDRINFTCPNCEEIIYHECGPTTLGGT